MDEAPEIQEFKLQRKDTRRRTIASIKSHIVNDMQNQGQDEISDRLSEKPKKVLILNTGGTISMFPSPKGYVTQKGALLNFLKNNPYSCDNDYTFFQSQEDFIITPITQYNRRIWYRVQELDKLIDSSNMCLDDWITIASTIELNYDHYDSFIILHGTDTMAYTASALSFMFQNLTKTIILTGSQVPLSQPRNDGFTNLLNALTVAGHFTIPEVLISFADKLLRGNRAQKVNSVALDSFDSPKYPCLGQYGVQIQIKWDLILHKQNQVRLQVEKRFSTEVSAIRLNPLMNHVNLRELLDNQNLKGLVIETYGAGNMQTTEEFFNEIKRAKENGIIIVNISQCHKSQVEMLYETGIVFQQIGVISGGDMTTEAAITKLAYLLGQELSDEEIKDQFQKNLRGELTPPTSQNADAEPFLVALSQAIKSQTDNADINRDLVFPNLLCQLSLQKKPISSMDIDKLEINYAASDYDKRTVLHVAAREGSLDIAELLLKEAPGIVDSVDRWNHSPMFEAVMGKHQDMIHLIARNGGTLIAPLNELTNILTSAIKENHFLYFDLFFQAGVRDFSQFRTMDNRSLAHVAVTFNNNEVINFLRKSGIKFDWNVKDRFGRTASDEMKYQKRKLK